MRKTIDVSFNPIDGDGNLYVQFAKKDIGVAADSAKEGIGVYWNNRNGELAAVQFESVNELNDYQKIVTEDDEWVSVKVTDGAITVDASVLKNRSHKTA